MREEFLWVEKYRPRTVAETILPDNIKATFQQFVDRNEIPNLMLPGGAGTGKTTIARALCEEVGADYIIINGSMNGGIDTLRNDIKNFASTVSFSGGRKIVILDEADYLTPQTQAALRNFMEEFSKNCGFILTCNFKNRIIAPLHSRCSVIDFKIANSDKPKLAAQLLKRCEDILAKEGVDYDKQALAAVIMKFYPDNRRILNELQRYGASGKIDSGILAGMSNENFRDLVTLVKEKKWKDMRKWVGENLDTEPTSLMRKFYDQAFDLIEPQSIPTMVLLIADYQYKAGFVADQEINLVAFLTQCMTELEFK
ncbi:sliding clamp loader subunit [Stenotrophomonas phage vB_SmaS-DLP_6]|nr:sliding clamp loader subunit [Stenotrophomonas phage vB_SmaS-DLP_6]